LLIRDLAKPAASNGVVVLTGVIGLRGAARILRLSLIFHLGLPFLGCLEGDGLVSLAVVRRLADPRENGHNVGSRQTVG